MLKIKEREIEDTKELYENQNMRITELNAEIEHLTEYFEIERM
jgi:hypothetical protein